MSKEETMVEGFIQLRRAENDGPVMIRVSAIELVRGGPSTYQEATWVGTSNGGAYVAESFDDVRAMLSKAKEGTGE